MADDGAQGIRIARLRRLAEQFLDAAEQYPRVFHFVATCSSRDVMKELLPWSESREVFAEEWRDDPTNSDHHYKNHHGEWGYVLDSLATDVNLFAVDQHSMSLGGKLWIGAFGIERPDGISNDSDLEPRPEIDRFAELAVNAANEFTDAPLPQMTASGAEMLLRFDRTDSRWLSLVYSELFPSSAKLRIGLTAMTLPFDVFTSSAKAIELLANSSGTTPPRWSPSGTMKRWEEWHRKAKCSGSWDTIKRRLAKGIYVEKLPRIKGQIILDINRLPPEMQSDEFWKRATSPQ